MVGVDGEGCGWSDVPCYSLEGVLGHVSGIERVTLSEGTHGGEMNGVAITQSVTVTGVQANHATLSVASLGGALFSLSGGASGIAVSVQYVDVAITTLAYSVYAVGTAGAGVTLTLADLTVSGTSSRSSDVVFSVIRLVRGLPDMGTMAPERMNMGIEEMSTGTQIVCPGAYCSRV